MNSDQKIKKRVRERIEKDKKIAWTIGAIIVLFLEIWWYIKTGDYTLWKPIAAVFFPVGIFYIVIEILQEITLKFTQDRQILFLVRFFGIILGFVAALLSTTLWWKTISFSL